MKIKILIFFLFLTGFATAQEKTETKPELPKAQVFDSKQSVVIDGKTIALNAKAGTFQLKDENNKPLRFLVLQLISKKTLRKTDLSLRI